MLTTEEMMQAAERVESQYFKPVSRIREIRIPDAESKLRQIFGFLLSNKEEKLQWLPVYDEVVRWLENNERKGLLIMGNCGTGKTLLCSEVIPMLFNIEFNQNYRAVPSWALTEEWKSLLNDDICIIDDVGVEPVGMKYGEPVHAFATLVSNAEETGQLLIMTTNLNHDELKRKYGTRVLDRIRGNTRTIAIPGSSFR